MRIASWNVNSLKARLPRVEEFLGYADVDVLCLQETKLSDAAFPQLQFASLGYESVHYGQGQWNGVAILSRVGIDDAHWGFGDGIDDPYEGDARLLTATCGGVQCTSMYVPNGRAVDTEFYERKLVWLGALRDWLAAKNTSGRSADHRRRLQRRARGPRRLGPEGVRRRDPRHRTGARGGAGVVRLGDAGRLPARVSRRTTGSTPTGTTAPATSTNTAACASTSRSRRSRSPIASRGPSSIATRARAPDRPTTRR